MRKFSWPRFGSLPLFYFQLSFSFLFLTVFCTSTKGKERKIPTFSKKTFFYIFGVLSTRTEKKKYNETRSTILYFQSINDFPGVFFTLSVSLFHSTLNINKAKKASASRDSRRNIAEKKESCSKYLSRTYLRLTGRRQWHFFASFSRLTAV